MGTDYVPGDEPGVWRQDPISQLPVALGAHWGEVRPLVIRSGKQFRVPRPPTLSSPSGQDFSDRQVLLDRQGFFWDREVLLNQEPVGSEEPGDH